VHPLDSVSYRFHNTVVAVDASDAVAPCPPLPAEKASDSATRLGNASTLDCVISSTMSSFSAKGLLGELEQLVLLAVTHQEPDAYAVSIRDEIEARTGIALRRGSVYVTLQRLERKGYLASSWGPPTPERGGKAKRCFALTASGRRALVSAEDALARMKRQQPLRSTR
jgi:PadR family transcriptional regulator, regulatory protein PadR